MLAASGDEIVRELLQVSALNAVAGNAKQGAAEGKGKEQLCSMALALDTILSLFLFRL